MDPSDPRIPCLPQLKEMLAQGGKVRDTSLKCPLEYDMKSDLGLDQT